MAREKGTFFAKFIRADKKPTKKNRLKPTKHETVKRKKKRWKHRKTHTTKDSVGIFMVAETGFEPRDLRVMSPTSYRTAPLRDIYVVSLTT